MIERFLNWLNQKSRTFIWRLVFLVLLLFWGLVIGIIWWQVK